MSWFRWLFVGLGAALATPTAVAVVNGSQRPSFEVASIKPQKPGDLRSPRLGFPPGGRFEATGATLLDLMTLAYGPGDAMLRRSQVVGGPDWIRNDRFDVVAKTERAVALDSPTAPFEMLKALLEDRFALEVHRETRQLPVYALVMARTDGRLGPQLRRADDCTRPGAPAPRAGDSARPCAIAGGYGVSTGRGVPIAFFINGRLSNILDRMVIDRTDLTGFFDWDLEWTPAPSEPVSPTDRPASAADGPSIFTALEEQLGLKLAAERGPVEVVVIDHVSLPTPD